MSTSTPGKIRLKILEAFSPDVPREYLDFDFYSVSGFEAPNPTDVQFVLMMTIGNENESVANDFQVMVFTRNKDFLKTEKLKYLEFEEYKWLNLRTRVLSIIKECSGGSWDESVDNLRKYFEWEYEDYSHN
jgi:Immunity protein 8